MGLMSCTDLNAFKALLKTYVFLGRPLHYSVCFTPSGTFVKHLKNVERIFSEGQETGAIAQVPENAHKKLDGQCMSGEILTGAISHSRGVLHGS
jgi:hypothetical protein